MTDSATQTLRVFLEANPSFRLQDFAGTLSTELKVEEGAHDQLVHVLQRAFRLHPTGADALSAWKVVCAGYGSLRAIARRSEDSFVADLAAELPAEDARELHRRARGAQSRVVQAWMRQREALSKQRSATHGPRAAAPEPSSPVPIQSTLFGNAPIQRTPDEMSVFGPGAYLYDLLDLVEEAITQKNPDQAAAFTLRGRRPDLWNLLLTPEAMENPIAQAELVREVLESTLLQLAPAWAPVRAPSPHRSPSNLRLCADYNALKDALTEADEGDVLILQSSIEIPADGESLTIDRSVALRAATSDIVIRCTDGTALEIGAPRVALEGLDFASTGPGRAIALSSGVLLLTDTAFERKASDDVLEGWAVRCTGGELTARNATFVDRNAVEMTMISAAGTEHAVTVNLLNCILWRIHEMAKPSPVLDHGTGTAVFNLAYCDVFGGDPDDPAIYWDLTNLSADPGLMPGDQVSALRALPSDSPCVGRGARGANLGAASIDIYGALAQAGYPLGLPVDLSARSALMALSQIGLRLADVVRTFAPFSDTGRYVGASQLGLGPGEVAVLADAESEASRLAPYYGLPSTDGFDGSCVVTVATEARYRFRAAEFARWMGLTPDGLRALIDQDLSPAELASGVQRGEAPWSSLAGGIYSGFRINAGLHASFAIRSTFVPVGRGYPTFRMGTSEYAYFPVRSGGEGSFTVSLWMYVHEGAGDLLSVGRERGADADTLDLVWVLDEHSRLRLVFMRTKNWAGNRPPREPGDRDFVKPQLTTSLRGVRGRWAHLCSIYDASTNEMTLLLDGELLASSTLDFGEWGEAWASNDIHIRPSQNRSTLEFHPSSLQLSVAELVFSSVARAPETVAREFQRNPGLDEATLGYWPMNDGCSDADAAVLTVKNQVKDQADGELKNYDRRTPWATAGLPERLHEVSEGESLEVEGLLYVEQRLLTAVSAECDQGISPEHLDRMHRFVRLAMRLGWTFAELDQTLAVLGVEMIGALEHFDQLARIQQIREETGMGVAEVCALLGPLKPYGRGRSGKLAPPFDQAFNRPPLSGMLFSPLQSRSVTLPEELSDLPSREEIEQQEAQLDPLVRRVAASLRVSVAELRRMVEALWPEATDRTYTLDWSTLSLLFRYRGLMTLLDSDVDSVAQLLEATGIPAMETSLAPADLLKLVEVTRQLRLAEITPANLLCLVTDPLAGTSVTDPDQRNLVRRFRDRLPELIEDLERELAPWRLTPLSFVRPGVDAATSAGFFSACVDQKLLTQSGLATEALVARLPELTVRVPANEPTIQAGLDAAVDALEKGVTSVLVLVAPGDYEGEGNTGLTADLSEVEGTLLIHSEGGAERTILHAPATRTAPMLHIQSAAGKASAEVVGFTFQDSETAVGFGALSLEDLPRVLVQNCRFLDVQCDKGALSTTQSADPSVKELETVVSDCVFYGNRGTRCGALYVSKDQVRLNRCTLYDNVGSRGEYAVLLEGRCRVNVTNSILPSDQVQTNGCSFSVSTSYDGDNPHLAHPEEGDFALAEGSPAIGLGSGGTDPGYQPDLALSADLLLSSAATQLEILERALTEFYECAELPLVPVIRYAGRYRDGLVLLADGGDDAQILQYLRLVYLYLLLCLELGLETAETSQLLADPGVFLPPRNSDDSFPAPWIPRADEIQLLGRFAAFRQRYPDTWGDLLAFLRKARVSPPSWTAATTVLSDLFRWDPVQTGLLCRSLDPSTSALTAILDLSRALDLAGVTGLGVGVLDDLNRRGFVFGAEGATPLLQAVASLDSAASAELGADIVAMKREVLKGAARPAIESLSPDSALRLVDDDTLSDYLLTDVRADTGTSRVVEATLSVQRYIERARLRLEPGITDVDLSDERWAWMASYRKWEANRKVFLFPENFLRPELRKDRTPLFDQLLDEVEGAQLNAARVKQLYKKYLDGFVRIANLRVTGAWFDPADAQADDPVSTLWMIGRTVTQPYAWHVRSLEHRGEGTAVTRHWTPWAPIPLEIDADIVTPVLFRGQLYLFWSERVFVPDPDDDVAGGQHRVRIRLAARRADGGWGSAQSPFPELTLPREVRSTDDPVWRRVYALPTTYDGEDALYVQYGDFTQEGAPRLFVLCLDHSVIGGLRFAEGQLDGESAVSSAPNAVRSPGRLVAVEGMPLVSASTSPLKAPLVLASVNPSGVDDAGHLQLGALRTTTSLSHEKVPATLHSGPVTGDGAALVAPGFTFHDGRYYLAPSLDGTIYASAAWGVPGSWEEGATLPLTAEVKSIPHLAGAHGWLYATYRYESGATHHIQVLRSRSGRTWEPLFILEDVGEADPSLAVYGDALHGLYTSADGKTLKRFQVERDGWTITTIHAAEVVFHELSPLVWWRGYWYLAAINAGNGSCVVNLLSATELDEEWHNIGTVGTVPYMGTDRAQPGLSLEATSAGLWLVYPAGSGNTQTASATRVLSSKGLSPRTVGWPTVLELDGPDEKGAPQSALTRGPFAKIPQSGTTVRALLRDPGEQVAATPVGNQLSTFLVSTKNGDFLAQAIDTNGAAHDGRATVEIVNGEVKFKGRGLDYVKQAGTSFHFHRLSSGAAVTLSKRLNTGGLDALFSEATQRTSEPSFAALEPGTKVSVSPPDGSFSYDLEEAYGLYYRELYYFIPWLLADRLRDAHRYQEAQDWLDRVFCPTAPGDASAVWTSDWLAQIGDAPDPQSEAAALAVYHEDPFDANAIAELRPNAYRRAIFLAYLRNLIDWGDERFGLGQRETNQEASQIYRTAQDILGPRPEELPYEAPPPQSYGSLAEEQAQGPHDEFLLEVAPARPTMAPRFDPSGNLPVQGAYFGLPDNPELLRLWDEVEDRQFKLRHGLDLQGAPAAIPLFAPALNPAQLVEAASSSDAAAPSISSQTIALWEKAETALLLAKELTQSVITFGQSLFNALQMGDAEALEALQLRHEVGICEQLRQCSITEVDEATASLASMARAKDAATERKSHYEHLLARGLSDKETDAIDMYTSGITLRKEAAVGHAIASPLHLIPNIIGLANGGMEFGSSAAAIATCLDGFANADNEQAALLSLQADHERRAADWRLEVNLATHDIAQLDAEIEAGQRRVEALQQQYAIEEATLKARTEVEAYYRTRFTNEELYDWMSDTLGDLYFQLYQVAAGAARTAQNLVNSTTQQNASYITPGGWDAQHRGLLAGERLLVDLARMESEFAAWAREQAPTATQITLPLSRVAPGAPQALRRSGSCEFQVQQADLDRLHPGQYLRRLTDVRVRFVGWEDEAVHGTLVQESGSLVCFPDATTAKFLLGHGRETGRALGRSYASVKARFDAVEGATGPLEGFAGAPVAGRYRLEIPASARRMNPDNLSDVVLELRYQGRDGSRAFQRQVEAALPPCIDAREVVLDEAGPDGRAGVLQGGGECEVDLGQLAFPRNLPHRTWSLNRAWITLEVEPGDGGEVELDVGLWQGPGRALLPAAGGIVTAAAPLAESAHLGARTPVRISGDLRALRKATLHVEAVEGASGASQN